MLSFATISLLAMATVMAILVSVASRALLRPTAGAPRHFSFRGPGLRLAVSLVIAAATLTVFVEVADNVLDQDELARFDGYVMAALQPLRTTTGLAVARAVSLTGTFPFMTLLAVVIVLTIHRRHWRAVLLGWALVGGGASSWSRSSNTPSTVPDRSGRGVTRSPPAAAIPAVMRWGR